MIAPPLPAVPDQVTGKLVSDVLGAKAATLLVGEITVTATVAVTIEPPSPAGVAPSEACTSKLPGMPELAVGVNLRPAAPVSC